jgi:hypothetical protein
MSLLLHVFNTATNAWEPATNDLINSVKAVGYQVGRSASFTRPADTTAYAAQDVVSNSTSSPVVLTFADCGRVNGGSGVILSARHMKQGATATPNYRLHLYRVAPTAINDNAQFGLLFANQDRRIGFIDFVHQTGGTGSDCSSALTPFVNLPFVCDAASDSLFGILTTTSGYTPVSAEQHFIELSVVQN